jgi:hypothetical protein
MSGEKQTQTRRRQPATLKCSISFQSSSNSRSDSHQQALLDLVRQKDDIIQLRRDGNSLQEICDEVGDLRAHTRLVKARLATQVSGADSAGIKSAVPS